MAKMKFANNANTTLASSLTAIATSMSVTSATKFPVLNPLAPVPEYFYCTLTDVATNLVIEIVKVTVTTGTTWTIARGQDGTTGTAFAAGDTVSLRLVRASLDDFPKLDEANTFTGVLTASGGVVGNLTGNASTVTTNANLTGPITSVGNATSIASQTGTGTTFAMSASPTFTGTVGAADLTTTGNTILGNASTDTLNVGNGGLIKDASGNVGIGVTPSAWGSPFKAIDIATGTSIFSQTNDNTSGGIVTNAYYNSGYKYKATGLASQYYQTIGTHVWYTASSGTAGNAITFIPVMTLDASGRLKLDTTIGVGAATPSASGAGITFPATQSASTDANTLDDYRELTTSATACTGAITANATYKLTKAGNQVVLTILAVTGTATAATNFRVNPDIPAVYRPTTNTTFPVCVYDAGARSATIGMAYIGASGSIQIFASMTAVTNFTALGQSGILEAQSVSWTL